MSFPGVRYCRTPTVVSIYCLLQVGWTLPTLPVAIGDCASLALRNLHCTGSCGLRQHGTRVRSLRIPFRMWNRAIEVRQAEVQAIAAACPGFPSV